MTESKMKKKEEGNTIRKNKLDVGGERTRRVDGDANEAQEERERRRIEPEN